MNYYTVALITVLGELIGQVMEVAFDLFKAQSKEYVRVKVRFDVFKPLRGSKVVNLLTGNQQ